MNAVEIAKEALNHPKPGMRVTLDGVRTEALARALLKAVKTLEWVEKYAVVVHETKGGGDFISGTEATVLAQCRQALASIKGEDNDK